jgi:hypothetical protein
MTQSNSRSRTIAVCPVLVQTVRKVSPTKFDWLRAQQNGPAAFAVDGVLSLAGLQCRLRHRSRSRRRTNSDISLCGAFGTRSNDLSDSSKKPIASIRASSRKIITRNRSATIKTLEGNRRGWILILPRRVLDVYRYIVINNNINY